MCWSFLTIFPAMHLPFLLETRQPAPQRVFFVHYGFPSKSHSDKAQTFELKVIRHLFKPASMQGSWKTRTTPYHPMGNGQVERFNQTLLQMLGTLEPPLKSDWKSYVSPLVHVYNATRHDSTDFSPFFLMFGRHHAQR